MATTSATYVMTPSMLAEAAALRHGGGPPVDASKLKDITLPKTVVIDTDADQKYVIVELKTTPPVYFVRGSRNAAFHKDAALPLIEEFKQLALPYEVVGGGKILHSSADKTIRVYGVSNGFPWENGVSKHPISAQLLQEEFPGFKLQVADS